MPQSNYLFRGPNLAEIDESAYRNDLLANERDRIPQYNRQQDQQIQAQDQQINDTQRKNAAGVLGRNFSIAAQSPRPRDAARALISSPDFQTAGKLVGLPVEQFTITDQDTDDTIRQQLQTWSQALGSPLEQQDRYTQEPGPGGSLLQRNARTNQLSSIVGREPTAASGPDSPSGYRWKADGTQEPVPGGPADPSGPGARRASMQLRKEYEDQDAVKTYRTVLPLYQRATTAPDNRAGDISVIYALGKMFDPTSVVREGELQLASTSAPWLQQMAASINSQITGEGRLSPATRASIMQALNGQVEALRAPYIQERQRYGQYATDSGFDSNSVIGPDPSEAFAAPQTQTTFETEQEAEAAAAAGRIKPGTRITVGGVSGVWQ